MLKGRISLKLDWERWDFDVSMIDAIDTYLIKIDTSAPDIKALLLNNAELEQNPQNLGLFQVTQTTTKILGSKDYLNLRIYALLGSLLRRIKASMISSNEIKDDSNTPNSLQRSYNISIEELNARVFVRTNLSSITYISVESESNRLSMELTEVDKVNEEDYIDGLKFPFDEKTVSLRASVKDLSNFVTLSYPNFSFMYSFLNTDKGLFYNYDANSKLALYHNYIDMSNYPPKDIFKVFEEAINNGEVLKCCVAYGVKYDSLLVFSKYDTAFLFNPDSLDLLLEFKKDFDDFKLELEGYDRFKTIRNFSNLDGDNLVYSLFQNGVLVQGDTKFEKPVAFSKSYELSSVASILGYKKIIPIKQEDGKAKVKEVVKTGANLFHSTFSDLVLAHPDKNFYWLLDQKYEIVNDDNFHSIVEYLLGFDIWGVDTETTGLNINENSRMGIQTDFADVMVGIIVSVKEGESFYFPVRHTEFKNLFDGDDIKMMSYLKMGLETKKCLVYNASFDWKVVYIYGISMSIFVDIQALFKVTIEAEKSIVKASLKSTTNMILGLDTIELNDLVIGDVDFKNSGLSFGQLSEELTPLYACPDGDTLIRLYNFAMANRYLEVYQAEFIVKVESLFGKVIGYSEFHGIQVDLKRLPSLKYDIQQGIDESKKILFDYIEEVGATDLFTTGKTGFFNYASPNDKKTLLYDVMGLPTQYNMKTGKATTDKDAMKNLIRMYDQDTTEGTILRALQSIMNVSTLKTNFIDSIESYLDDSGRFYSSVNQFLATGRVSVNTPNYQSFNDRMKGYIVARDGYYISDSDYSGIEYRIIASMSGEQVLVDAFEDPDMDYHRLQASNVHEIAYDLIQKALRQETKAINFGLAYGMGDKKLAFSLFGNQDPVSVQKAKNARARYFKKQPKVQEFFEGSQRDAALNGFTSTLYGRRRYKAPNVKVGDFKRQGGNHRIQGTAADIYKTAMVRVFEYLVSHDLLGKVFMNAFVHDEIVFEISNEINPYDWMRIAKECMELKIPNFCPLYIGFGFGDTWYRAKSDEVPARMQQEIVESGAILPDWNLGIESAMKTNQHMIEEFQANQVYKYLTDESNSGKVLSTVISGYLSDIVGKFLGTDAFKGLDITSNLEHDTLPVKKEIYEFLYVYYYVKNGKLPVNFSEIQTMFDGLVEVLDLSQVEIEVSEDVGNINDYKVPNSQTDEEFDKEIFNSRLSLLNLHIDYTDNIIYVNAPLLNGSLDTTFLQGISEFTITLEEAEKEVIPAFKVVISDFVTDKENPKMLVTKKAISNLKVSQVRNFIDMYYKNFVK